MPANLREMLANLLFPNWIVGVDAHVCTSRALWLSADRRRLWTSLLRQRRLNQFGGLPIASGQPYQRLASRLTEVPAQGGEIELFWAYLARF